MKGFDQVHLGENGGVLEGVAEVSEVREGVAVLLGLGVQEPEVPAGPVASRALGL